MTIVDKWAIRAARPWPRFRFSFGAMWGIAFERAEQRLYFAPLPFLILSISFAFRVPCYKCGKPAVLSCVHEDPRKVGLAYGCSVRDPLCIDCGVGVGLCPDNCDIVRGVHLAIAADMCWQFDPPNNLLKSWRPIG